MKKLFLFSLASALALYLVVGLVDFGDAAGKGKPPPPPAAPPNPVIAYVAVAWPYNELAVADADGKNQTALLSSDQVGYFFPNWSPDLNPIKEGFQGSIVYEQGSQARNSQNLDLWVVDVEITTSGVTYSNARELVRKGSAAAWSPQGDKIAYLSHDDDPSKRGIRILDLVSGVDSLLIPDPTPEDSTQNANWPAWNPAGTRLAYTYYYYDGQLDHSEVRIRDLSNGYDFTLVENFSASALDWSRSGKFIAAPALGGITYVTAASDEFEEVTIETLPGTTWAQSPTWKPDTDDNQIVYMNRNRSGASKRKIVEFDLTTGIETVIIERNTYHLYEPDWRR